MSGTFTATISTTLVSTYTISTSTSITNTGAVLPAAGGYGIRDTAGGTTLTNSGKVGGNKAIYVGRIGQAGSGYAYINNQLSGVINGTVDGIYMTNGGGTTIQNFGTIQGGTIGVNDYDAESSAVIQNSGLITGGKDGVLIFRGVVGNTNPIYGRYTNNGGILINTGTVSGAVGVVDYGGGTSSFGNPEFGQGGVSVVNAGTIIGTSGTAVSFGDIGYRSVNPSDVLGIYVGAVFSNGSGGEGVVVDAADTGILLLESSATAGTITGIGSQFRGFNSATEAYGASWTLTGYNSISSAEATIAGYIGRGPAFTLSSTPDNGGLFTQNTKYDTLVNAAGATLAAGIYAEMQGDVVINAGLVTEQVTTNTNDGAGIKLGGIIDYLSNSVTGTISGVNTGVYTANAVTVDNSGLITGQTGVSVQGNSTVSGYLNNYGVILGTSLGVSIGMGEYLANYSLISSGGDGIVVDAPDAFYPVGITNAAGATIVGADVGVSLVTTSALVNAGTIIGNSGTAVVIGYQSGSTLVVDPGAVFDGVVEVTPAQQRFQPNDTVLELAAGASETLALGTEFINFGTVDFDAGATWDVEGSAAALAALGGIDGFAVGDTLDITNFVATSEVIGQSEVTLSNGTSTEILNLAGFSNTSLEFQSDGNGGTEIIAVAPADVVAQSPVTLGSAANPGYSYTLGAGRYLNITGGSAILTAGANAKAGTVTNFGTITAAQGGAAGPVYGVLLANGGTVVNEAGAYLQSIDIQGTANPGVILNAGEIKISANATYIDNSASGVISLANAATIENSGLIYTATATTVTNAGTILDATAATIANTGTISVVTDSALATDTITNAGTIGSVQNSGAGTFENQGFVSTASYGSIINEQSGTIGGGGVTAASVINDGIILGNINANVSAAGESILNAGNIIGNVSAGSIGVAATIENTGYIGGNVYLSSGVLIEAATADIKGTIEGQSYARFGGHATLELAAGVGTISSFEKIDGLVFDNGAQWDVTASLDAFSGYNNGGGYIGKTGLSISGFGIGDTLDIAGFTLGAAGDTSSYGVSAGQPVLDFTNGSTSRVIASSTYIVGQGVVNTYAYRLNTYAMTIGVNTSITNPSFIFTSDGHGGTDITVEGTVVAQALVTLGSAAHPSYSYTLEAGHTLDILGANAILAPDANGAAGTVVNDGTITVSPDRDAKSVVYGISLANGGTVINAVGAYLEGVDIQGTENPGILLNAGTIEATTRANYVSNSAGGYISIVNAMTVNNSGTIVDATVTGAGIIDNTGMISSASASVITNIGSISNATATIVTNTGTIGGLTALANDTVQNAGTITSFTGGGAGTLDNQGYVGSANGGTIVNHETIGSIAGSTTLLNYGVVLGSANGGMIVNDDEIGSVVGTTLLNYGVVLGNASGGTVVNHATIGGSVYGLTYSTIINQGVINGNAYGSTIINDGTITGKIIESTNQVINGFVFGNGTGSFLPGATNTTGVDLIASPGGTGTLSIYDVNTVTFTNGSNWLVEGGFYSDIVSQNARYPTRTYGTQFLNFGVGDTIDITGAGTLVADSATFSTGPNSDYISFATNFGAYRVDIQTEITNPNFIVSADGNGGVDITIACYLRGTKIRTVSGEVTVEDLVIGDLVATLSGAARKIKWIGRRSYDGRFIAGNHLALPVCIKTDAIAKGIPAHDLFVSPGHAIFCSGVLVPAWRLINGVTITQAETVEYVEYFHIELEEHDIIFAENCPAESFYDEDFRAQFHNSSEFYTLYPDAAPSAPVLPRVEGGFALQGIQRRLHARAGALMPVALGGALCGFVDQAGPSVVTGWAQEAGNAEAPVCLDVFADGNRVARVLANQYRADLRAAGLGSGCHGFVAEIPAGITGPVEVRRAGDGAVLGLTEAALVQAA